MENWLLKYYCVSVYWFQYFEVKPGAYFTVPQMARRIICVYLSVYAPCRTEGTPAYHIALSSYCDIGFMAEAQIVISITSVVVECVVVSSYRSRRLKVTENILSIYLEISRSACPRSHRLLRQAYFSFFLYSAVWLCFYLVQAFHLLFMPSST